MARPAIDLTASDAPEEPEHPTTAQQALNAEAARLRAFGVTAASRVHEDDDVNFGRALTLDDLPNHEDSQ